MLTENYWAIGFLLKRWDVFPSLCESVAVSEAVGGGGVNEFPAPLESLFAL